LESGLNPSNFNVFKWIADRARRKLLPVRTSPIRREALVKVSAKSETVCSRGEDAFGGRKGLVGRLVLVE
jgi:hypothetical protein